MLHSTFPLSASSMAILLWHSLRWSSLKGRPYWGFVGTSAELRWEETSLTRMLRLQRECAWGTAGSAGPSSGAYSPPLALHLPSLVPTCGVIDPGLCLLINPESWIQDVCWERVPSPRHLHMEQESLILKGPMMYLFSEVTGQTKLPETEAQFIKLRWLIMGQLNIWLN